MNISENNMFEVRHTPFFSNSVNTKKGWTNCFLFIRKNGIIIISLLMFFIALCCNFVLLYNFFSILQGNK